MRRVLVRLVGGAMALAVAMACLVVAPVDQAEAAGVTTHSWMALEAIELVEDPRLEALLRTHREVVRRGGHFPDSGYVGSNQYGEEAHWQRFNDAYLDQIKARPDCGDLSAPDGPCAPAVAHLFGSMAHGMGDEVWDWLFEPNSPDLGEYYQSPDFGGFDGVGGQELQMDLVALADFDQPTGPFVPVPSKPDLLSAFGAVDFAAVDDAALELGSTAMTVVLAAEAIWAPRHIDRLREAMPWMSHNLRTAPGGVDFAAAAIAAAWEASWGRLLGDQPETEVSVTYPADGQRRIPSSGWVRSYSPGSNPGTGGARTRITAVLTYSRPYLPLATSTGSIPTLLPADSLRLTERDTGASLPVLSGYPKSVPYTANPGHHLVDIQPATDLAPCTWYVVDVTENLVDALDRSVVPHQWEFRTGADAAGSRCADDPYTDDERYVRAVVDEVLGRDATETELQEAAYDFDRGAERSGYLDEVFATTELRGRIVDQAYRAYLGRSPDAATQAAWTGALDSISIPVFQALVLGTVDVYRAAGRTNGGFVDALYERVLGRLPSSAERAAALSALAGGAVRATIALELLTGDEAARRVVAYAHLTVLGRDPEPDELERWTDVVVTSQDLLAVWAGLMAGDEFEQVAQG